MGLFGCICVFPACFTHNLDLARAQVELYQTCCSIRSLFLAISVVSLSNIACSPSTTVPPGALQMTCWRF